jgi:hypothetical protein
MIALPNRKNEEYTDYAEEIRRTILGPVDAAYKLCDKLGIRRGNLDHPGERKRMLKEF